jgi:dTDP-4-dehydrorhamnose 3,5-epimerase
MIEGVKIINFIKVKDSRGYFSKIFNEKFFNINNIKFKTKEHFISFSKKDVIRGMHYQSGRYAQNKLVYVISGKINDVFIDLRKNSKTYLRTQNIVLSSANNKAIFLPRGVAHGFRVLSESSIIGYLVDNFYNKAHDKGVLWSSINYQWKIKNPNVSKRDKNFPSLDQYDY